MLISQAIQDLQSFQNKYGDMPVMVVLKTENDEEVLLCPTHFNVRDEGLPGCKYAAIEIS